MMAIEKALKAAHDASMHAYAPYSNYHVGAAIMLDDGDIIVGSNLENASYGLSLCAETAAIASANSQSKLRNITAIALVGGKPDDSGRAILTKKAITPCGRCRQIIKEVADVTNKDIAIYCLREGGYMRYALSEILPDAFDPNNIA